MLKAVIFDMDGVLIDSEPLWKRAEVEAFKEVGLSLTEEMCGHTMGLRLDEVVEFWFRKHPWKQKSKKEVEGIILKNMLSLVTSEGTAKEGTYQALEFFAKQNVKLGLASSSPSVLINATMERLDLKSYFSVTHSAEFEERGKPDPGVYITTAKQLGVEASACIAIEDSLNGIVSAKAAGMRCIAIPEPHVSKDERFQIADKVLLSLMEINQEFWVNFAGV